MNSLLADSHLPFLLPDYAHLTDQQFEEAIITGLVEQRDALEMIATNPEAPTVENTLVAWELSSATLDRANAAFWVAKAAEATPERDRIESTLAPRFAEHEDAIWLDSRLYERLRRLRDRAEAGELELDEEDQHLLAENIREFERSGITLAETEKDRLREINSALSCLSVAFEQALVAGRNAAAVHVTNREELTGLSEEAIRGAAQAAEAQGRDGWLIELTNTTDQPVLEHLEDRELRRRVFEASISRGLSGEHDVRQLVLDIVHLRAERAQLLGYEHHAAWVAAGSCARTTDAVMGLLHQMVPGAMQLAEQEAARLEEALRQDHANATLASWDWGYYAAREAAANAVDPAALKPYLEFDRILTEGVFAAATALYGITFHRREELRGFTAESMVYEVREATGKPLGLYIIDPYTRDSKRGGAWMTSIMRQSRLTGAQPIVTNTCNFSRPVGSEPSLLTWANVTTLFHEFGHALHGLLSDVKYPSRSGTAVPRDFVEFPSQVNELWSWDEKLISRFAVHHETGKPLPADVVARLKGSRIDGQGFHTLETLAAMLLDQAWHTARPEDLPQSPAELEAFEINALKKAGVASEVIPPRYRSCYFSHIFGSMYSAAYYGYLWAEVLDADACAWFEANGGLGRGVGDRFRRELLARGGGIEAMQAWLNFRGAAPDVTYLLRRKGLSRGDVSS